MAARARAARHRSSLCAYVSCGLPALAWSSTSLNQRFALSYTANGWNLTANVVYGIQLDSVTDRPQISPCPTPFGFRGCNPNFINVDLTATKKFGNWEPGPVAFGSTDLTSPITGYQKQSQFAVGGLVGYDFGPVTLQAYATTEVAERNYGAGTRAAGSASSFRSGNRRLRQSRLSSRRPHEALSS